MTAQHFTENGSTRYGAQMGRHGSDNLGGLCVAKDDSPFTLQRVRLDSGGYDQGGAYWGHHQRLYWWSVTLRCDGLEEEASGYFRARDRAAAKAHVKDLEPAARFYR